MGGAYTASGTTVIFTQGYADTGMTKSSFKSSSDNSWTVAAWVKYTGSPSQGYSAIVGGHDPSGSGTEFFIGKNYGNTCLGVQDLQWYPDVCGISLFDGNYHSVVVSVASGSGTVYVDATNVYSNTWSGVNEDEQIRIGVELQGSGFYWAGEIKEVAFLERALTASEVLTMHQDMSTGTVYCQQPEPTPPPTSACGTRVGLKAYYNAGVSNVADGVWPDITGNFPATMGGAYTASGTTVIFTQGYADTGMTKSSFKSSSDNSWTVAAWVKYTGSPSQGYSAIVGGHDPSGSGTEFFIGKNYGNTCLGVQDLQWYPDVCGISLFDGNYHSVVVSVASGSGTVYVDATNVYSNTWSGVNEDEQIRIGVELQGSGFYWAGEIKEVAFLERALTASEVLTMHQDMSTGTSYCQEPTPAPTPSPTPAPAPAQSSAVGDPHMQNVHGERFDLTVPGSHVLINIPRGGRVEQALLRVQANSRRMGSQCADMYFTDVNVTGYWAEAKKTGGYYHSASQSERSIPEWVAFGKVELKIVHGRTGAGVSYLNVHVKHLARAGFPVGGLLGEDDHSDVSAPATECMQQMSLQTRAHPNGSVTPAASTAEGSLD